MRFLPAFALAVALAGAASPALAENGCISRYHKPVEIGGGFGPRPSGYGPRGFSYGAPSGAAPTTRQSSVTAAPPPVALPAPRMAPTADAPAVKKKAAAAPAAAEKRATQTAD